MKMLGHKLFILLLMCHILLNVSAQRTQLDQIFSKIYRPIRLLGLQLAGRTNEEPRFIERVRSLGRTQKLSPRTRSLSQFCDTENGAGKRSAKTPTSVHRLTPGDIDVIGAMGDSLTAGNGIFATNLLQVTVENRGVSWSIGGKDNWRTYMTLPNILKEFNPNLYGYSLRDGLATDRSSRFNVAELAAMSRDIPYEAQVLVKRLKNDKRVNMTEHWKMITLLIGNNDFCSDICYYQNPEDTIKWHEQNMLKTYRYLRDNVPRLMLNVVPPPNLVFLTRMTALPTHCSTTLKFECPCLMGKSMRHVKYYEDLLKKWIAKDHEVASREEFNTEQFTINLQTFTAIKDLPLARNGFTDYSMLSEDCFHLSQKGHALSANALWNNLLEPPGGKSLLTNVLFRKFNCPTDQHPYIYTRTNARADFKL